MSESNVGKHCQLHGTEKKPMRLEGRRVHKRNQWDLMALTATEKGLEWQGEEWVSLQEQAQKGTGIVSFPPRKMLQLQSGRQPGGPTRRGEGDQ